MITKEFSIWFDNQNVEVQNSYIKEQEDDFWMDWYKSNPEIYY